MSDGTAERTLNLRPLDVDVDPLLVTGVGAERVDVVLRDLQPVTDAKLPTGKNASGRRSS